MHKVFKGEQFVEFRVRFVAVPRLATNCFPKLRATFEIHRRSGWSMRRNPKEEIEIPRH